MPGHLQVAMTMKKTTVHVMAGLMWCVVVWDNLWSFTWNIFMVPTLTATAWTLLSKVLKHDYCLAHSKVQDIWAVLCVELVLAGLLVLVRMVWEEQEQGSERKMKRAL